MVEVVAGTVSGDVADPTIGASIDVGRGGMTGGVGLAASGQRRVAGGTVGGNVPAADGSAGGSAVGRGMLTRTRMRADRALGVGGMGQDEKRESRENCQRADDFLHDSSVAEQGTGYRVQGTAYRGSRGELKAR
jgi:hypothetical protein